jgi:carbamoyltransferase
MNILGISAYYHDSAACLVRDGKIVAAAQEERFTRRKHDHRFPSHAIDFCLRHAGIAAADLDHVVFYDKPLQKFERLIETYMDYAPRGWRSFLMAMPLWLGEKLWTREQVARELAGYKGAVLFTEHHEAHAASAFYPSPFERAAVLTIDGVGEWATSSYGYGRGNELHLTHELRFPHSLGLLIQHSLITLAFASTPANTK